MAKYRQVEGEVKWARFSLEPAFAQRQKRRTGARARGKQYEAKAGAAFAAEYAGRILLGPWIEYMDETGHHWCQPDGMLFNVHSGYITIIEMKYQHTPDAWLQLRRLYQPIVDFLFATPDQLWSTNIVEVVRWYDAQIGFPEPVRLTPALHLAHPRAFNVHIWNP